MNKSAKNLKLSALALMFGTAFAATTFAAGLDDFNSSGLKLRGDGSVDDSQPSRVVVRTSDDIVNGIKLRGDGTVDDSQPAGNGAVTDHNRSTQRSNSVGERVRSDASGRAERAERSERANRADRAERVERAERAERTERVERAERVERVERAERPEKVEKVEKAERPERSGRG